MTKREQEFRRQVAARLRDELANVSKVMDKPAADGGPPDVTVRSAFGLGYLEGAVECVIQDLEAGFEITRRKAKVAR